MKQGGNDIDAFSEKEFLISDERKEVKKNMCVFSASESCIIEGGLRTLGVFKKDDSKIPLITIITVVYNGEESIEATLKSVLSQKNVNIEYLVIDGASCDRTLQIVRKFENDIDYWVSENDEGIYHAMNKGVSLASGSWICFMNIGDTFFSEFSVSDAMANFPKCDVIYGDCMMHFGDSATRIAHSEEKINFRYGLPFCHQASFTRTALCKKKGFDLRYKIYADFAFFYNLHKQGCKFQKVNSIIANYCADGVSSRKTLRHYKEMYLIARNFEEKFSKVKFFRFLCLSFLKILIKQLLPLNILRTIQCSDLFSFFRKK